MENITLGNINNILVLIASIISSSGVICGLALAIGRVILKRTLEPFNKRIDETIENNNKRFNELTKQVDFNDIDTVRARISAFDQLCRLDKNYKSIQQHQYNTVFKDIDKWAMYHRKYPELNGEINAAIENINEHYKKAIFE